MISGFDTALGEVTLVLFTTLAPSGAIALVLVAAVLLFSKLESTMRARISTFMCIPLVVTMVGLVASATHLGNPANALYVFLHFGSYIQSVAFLGVISNAYRCNADSGG